MLLLINRKEFFMSYDPINPDGLTPFGTVLNAHTCKGRHHKGDYVYKLRDANGYFVAYVCDECYDEVKAKYRPEIFERPYDERDLDEGDGT